VLRLEKCCQSNIAGAVTEKQEVVKYVLGSNNLEF